MSDQPKNYSQYETTNDHYGYSPLFYNKLAPLPAAPPQPRALNLKAMPGAFTANYAANHKLAPSSSTPSSSKSKELYRGGCPPPRRYEEDLPYQTNSKSSSSSSAAQQQQTKQQYQLRLAATTQQPNVPFHQQHRLLQSVQKPSATSESRPLRDNNTISHRFGDNCHAGSLSSQADPKDSKEQEKFFKEVVAKLQALKKNNPSSSGGSSSGSKYATHYATDSLQAADYVKQSHDVLNAHYNNHFVTRILKKSRNESSTNNRQQTIKAICTYEEFDGGKNREITKYLLKPKSNLLRDLKTMLPSLSDNNKLFFKNQDNIFEQADNDDQPLYSIRDKEGNDIITCKIVVPRGVVPCLY